MASKRNCEEITPYLCHMGERLRGRQGNGEILGDRELSSRQWEDIVFGRRSSVLMQV